MQCSYFDVVDEIGPSTKTDDEAKDPSEGGQQPFACNALTTEGCRRMQEAPCGSPDAVERRLLCTDTDAIRG